MTRRPDGCLSASSLERQSRILDGIGFGPFTVPAADFYETDHDFVIELEVPGFEEKELWDRGV